MSDVDDLLHEVAMGAEQIAFWKFQAMWHRAKITGRDVDKRDDYRALEAEFEKFRIAENEGRRNGN